MKRVVNILPISNPEDDYIHQLNWGVVDRLNYSRAIAVFNTGDDELDYELAEQVLTMLNIKYIGCDDDG